MKRHGIRAVFVVCPILILGITCVAHVRANLLSGPDAHGVATSQLGLR
jgi:hypothetical protein